MGRRQYLYAVVFMDEFLGISHKLFQERYANSRTSSRSHRGSRRPNNYSLHSIIRFMETPQADMRIHRAPAGAALEGGSSSSSSSASSRRPAGGSGGRFGSRGSGIGSFLRRGGEERAGLAASVPTELELSTMASLSPSEHLNSGAISPAEESGENLSYN